MASVSAATWFCRILYGPIISAGARWARIRGMGLLISQVLAAIGPPFFGFLFDITGGYGLSFAIFGAVLMTRRC